MVVGKDPVILPSNIALPQFDYIALGHIHRQQVLATDPPACYSGSLARLDFSDEGLDKGFYLVELKEKRQAGSRLTGPPDFIVLETRRFITVKTKILPDEPDPTATIIAAIETHRIEIKDAILKIEINLPENRANLIQDKKILGACQDAHHVFIARHKDRESRSRLDITSAERLTPTEALRIYLERQSNLSPARKQLLLEYGGTLVNQTLSPIEADSSR